MDTLSPLSPFRNLKIVSLNARGLNIPERRSKLLLYLHSLKTDIAFIQETHFKTDHIPRWHSRDYPTMLHATNSMAKTKGTSILIAKHVPLDITDTLIDKDGRYVGIKGHIWNMPITLINIYAPNVAQATFLAAHRKKMAQKNISELLSPAKKLELTHKRLHALNHLEELEKIRDTIKDVFNM